MRSDEVQQKSLHAPLLMPHLFPFSEFPATATAIQEGIDRKLHTGVQIYIARNGTTVLDLAMGEAAPGVVMTSSTPMPWRSAGKPLTAVLILQQIEAGRLTLETHLCDVIHESSLTDKADVTILDLLTHQSGFPQTDTGWPHLDWDQSLHAILHEPRQLEIGSAAYHPQSSWFLLGEILRRLEADESQSSFAQILQRRLLNPLRMTETSCGFAPESLDSRAVQFPVLYERDKGQLTPSNYGRAPWITQPSPGASLRGPVRDLGRFLEMLLRGGQTESGQHILSPATVQQTVRRHRTGEFDQTFQHIVDFGLGVICNSNQYGPDTVPYGFGKYSSPTTFGHGGSQCSMGFCDPERGLVVAWSANGFCGEWQHQKRNRMINNAIYEDLGLIYTSRGPD